jgi:hypothetical protein
MDPLRQSSQQPPQLNVPGWYDRLLMWSGWDWIVEYHRSLIAAAVFLVAVICLIGWWVGRSESSSVGHMFRAEAIVERLRSPNSAPDETEQALETDRQRLFELTRQNASIADRFAGVVAEEELLQHAQELSTKAFETASQNLTQASLELHSTLVHATLLAHQEKTDEALNIINDIIEKSGAADSTAPYPELHAYALLQKASLLQQQKQSNGPVIDELHQWLTDHPSVDEALDSWFSGKGRQVINSLRYA